MNLKLTLSLALVLLVSNLALASFPVDRKVAQTEQSAAVDTSADENTFVPAVASEKSQGVALLLALTLGLLAAHRWYLKTPWPINIIFIFTLGGLGVWLLIDIIRIIAKDLTPVDGRYKRTFF